MQGRTSSRAIAMVVVFVVIATITVGCLGGNEKENSLRGQNEGDPQEADRRDDSSARSIENNNGGTNNTANMTELQRTMVKKSYIGSKVQDPYISSYCSTFVSGDLDGLTDPCILLPVDTVKLKVKVVDTVSPSVVFSVYFFDASAGFLEEVGTFCDSAAIIPSSQTYWVGVFILDPLGGNLESCGAPHSPTRGTIQFEFKHVEDQYPDVAGDCLRPAPSFSDPRTLLSGWEKATLDVAFAVDHEYQELVPGWNETVREYVDEISSIYEEEIDVQITAVHYASIPEGYFDDSPLGSDGLRSLKEYYDANYPDIERDLVYLFTGAGSFQLAGLAFCIGGAGFKDTGYAVGSGINEEQNYRGLEFFADPTIKIAVHEIGHLLSAHHHYANCAEITTEYDPERPIDKCTLMFNDMSLIGLSFSAVNKLVMRDHIDRVMGSPGIS